MSGSNYLFDTNALISFLQGNPQLNKFVSATSLGISIISVLEFLSFNGVPEDDKKLLLDFMKKVRLFELNLHDLQLIDTITSVRISYKLKLPDAIIAGTAIRFDAVLITNDKDFAGIPSLNILTF